MVFMKDRNLSCEHEELVSMNEAIRRAIAYAAAGRANGNFARSIYSFDRSKYTSMSENYDYEAGSHISGVRSGNMYHYGIGTHISLSVSGNRFKGYDYSSGTHFQGTISGNRISLYDYGDSSYFNYQV